MIVPTGALRGSSEGLELGQAVHPNSPQEKV